MKWLCGFALFIFTWWSSHTVFVSSQDNGSDVNFDSFSRWRRSAMDWNVVRRLWEKWASNNVGSSGGPAFSLGFLFGSIWIFDRVSLKPITRGCTKFQVSLWRQLYWLTMIRLDRLAWYQPCKRKHTITFLLWFWILTSMYIWFSLTFQSWCPCLYVSILGVIVGWSRN